MSVLFEWWAYCTVVSALFGLGASALEEAGRGLGRPGRWVWFGALVLSMALPLGAWSGLRTWSAPLSVIPEAEVFSLAPLAVTGAADGGGGIDASGLLTRGWVLASGLLSLWVALSIARLVVARRGWRVVEMDGTRVLVTRNTGPAVVGVGRGAIVMPEWVFALERRLRDLLFLHEREHLRAGDPRLLFGALLLVLLAPWNPALWWQLRRLRLAVEMDCDARVLRAKPDAGRYGALLLEVGRRRGGGGLVLAFSEPATFLERRIRMMTRVTKRNVGRAALPGLAGIALVVLAVCTEEPGGAPPGSPAGSEPEVQPETRLEPRIELPPEPEAIDDRTPDPAGPGEAGATESPSRPDFRDIPSSDLPQPPQPAAESDLARAPAFTPFTQAPSLQNRDEVEAALSTHYPPLLRDAGIGGQATLWFFIDTEGRVQNVAVKVSSGFDALDEAAGRVARTMRFTPARNRDRDVNVWVQIPVAFTPGGSAVRRQTERAPPTPPVAAARREPQHDLREQPAFTPFTVAPVLANRVETETVLRRNYPPLLRDAGIGGRAVLWFFIDESGHVIDTRIRESSGFDALDDAALRVASTMQFSPARNRDSAVPVWVQIPITFTAR